VAFNPNGARIVSGSWDQTVRLWDAEADAELHRFEGHTSGVTSVAFSPDGTRIVSGSEDRTVRLWDATPEPRRLAWRDAWREQSSLPDDVASPKLIKLIEQWERELGTHVNLETHEFEPVPNPGPGYQGTIFARYCK
jgi:WD40 repeat protein